MQKETREKKGLSFLLTFTAPNHPNWKPRKTEPIDNSASSCCLFHPLYFRRYWEPRGQSTVRKVKCDEDKGGREASDLAPWGALTCLLLLIPTDRCPNQAARIRACLGQSTVPLASTEHSCPQGTGHRGWTLIMAWFMTCKYSDIWYVILLFWVTQKKEAS